MREDRLARTLGETIDEAGRLARAAERLKFTLSYLYDARGALLTVAEVAPEAEPELVAAMEAVLAAVTAVESTARVVTTKSELDSDRRLADLLDADQPEV